MITITLNEEGAITVGELSVFPSKAKITGFTMKPPSFKK